MAVLMDFTLVLRAARDSPLLGYGVCRMFRPSVIDLHLVRLAGHDTSGGVKTHGNPKGLLA